jgi:hypothetical protein
MPARALDHAGDDHHGDRRRQPGQRRPGGEDDQHPDEHELKVTL